MLQILFIHSSGCALMNTYKLIYVFCGEMRKTVSVGALNENPKCRFSWHNRKIIDCIWFLILPRGLMLSILGKNSSRQHFEIFFLENRFDISCTKETIHMKCQFKPVFWENTMVNLSK